MSDVYHFGDPRGAHLTLTICNFLNLGSWNPDLDPPRGFLKFREPRLASAKTPRSFVKILHPT